MSVRRGRSQKNRIWLTDPIIKEKINMFTAMNSQAAMYIDPATTSYIIQIGAGLLIALGTFFGIFWSKIKRAFKKKEDEVEAIDASEINALHDGEKDVITADDLLSDDKD